MPEQVFFQCSLPRTGSTLFQNLMNQDPRFLASGNNGLLGLLGAAEQNYNNSPEFRAQDASLMAKAFSCFCKGSIHGFYNGITDKQFALDKSRGHFANYDLINRYYPNPKIICFVRNMPDIFASMEKMFRKNQHKSSRMVSEPTMHGISTPKRMLMWHQSFAPMMTAFEEAIAKGDDKKMLFIRYESFCANPETEMRRVYNFLGIPYYAHNFDNIPQTIKEDEEYYEYTGLLKLRPQLSMKPSDALNVLGKDVYDWIMNTYKNHSLYFSYR